MFVIGSNGPSGYNLTRSLRFRSSASAYLSRTPASASNRQIFTFSGWVKRGTLGARQGIIVCTDAPANNYFDIEFIAADQLDIQGSNGTWRLATSAVYRDPSAWYHIVLAVDTTQATASNRVKLYVNGSQVTAFSTASYPTLNSNCYFNLNAAHSIGSWQPASGLYFDGYLTEVNFIDGQALTPSSFGSTNALTGVWQPAAYTGSYGTNGFELQFTDNSAATAAAIGKDSSGNGNNWTPNNISVTAGTTYDSMTDVPTLTSATAANYCVLSPLDISTSNSQRPTDGNLTYPVAGAFQYSARGTIFVTSGKWYAEFTISASSAIVAVVNANAILFGLTGTNGVYALTTQIFNNSGTAAQTGLAAFAASDVIGVAFDAGASTVQFYKNNATYGTALTISGFAAPYAFQTGSNGAVCTINANFGQRPFTYTPPTGFVALNTFNLPTSTIVKGNTVMDATLYTGTGSALSITNAAPFQPDFVWIKRRDGVANHALFDSVRGVRKVIISNATDAEVTETAGTSLTAFNSNGFSLGTNGGAASVNINAATFVGWQWQAGQGSTSSNTNGSITSTVSVNASAGFSVVTYTGTGANATVGHGLGVAPQFIVVKARSTTGSWQNYHVSTGNTSAQFLNLDSATFASSVYWNNTSPTSSVFTIGTSSFVNVASQTQVAYCWTPIAGYSAFGSYTGNGSTDGPMVYTGFRPAVIMVKRTDTTGNWCMFDDKRLGYNGTSASKELYPNLSNAEGTSNGPDQLSNGFKLRDTYADVNASGGTYVYACWAENPFKNSLAR